MRVWTKLTLGQSQLAPRVSEASSWGRKCVGQGGKRRRKGNSDHLDFQRKLGLRELGWREPCSPQIRQDCRSEMIREWSYPEEGLLAWLTSALTSAATRMHSPHHYRHTTFLLGRDDLDNLRPTGGALTPWASWLQGQLGSRNIPAGGVWLMPVAGHCQAPCD